MKKTLGFVNAVASLLGSSAVALAAGTEQTGINTAKVPFSDLGAFIQVILSVAFIAGGLAAFAYLIMGGFQYITSGGDKTGAQSARDKITYAVLGLAVIAAAAAIVGVLQAVLGIQILGKINWPGPGVTVGT